MTVEKLLFELFVNRTNTYPKAWLDKKSNRMNYKRIEMPLTEDTIQKHIEGKETVGSYQLKEDKVSYGCCDFDLNTKEDFEKAKKLHKYLIKGGYHPLLEMSGGGEFKCHVFEFSNCEAKDMIYFLKNICKEINVKPCEIFPKQEKTE